VIATLPQSVELLERALGYTRGQLAEVTTDQLDAATPCTDWDLRTLLEHMDDALDAFLEAAGGVVALRARPADATAAGIIGRVQTKACTLVGVWAAAAERHETTVDIGAAAVPSWLLVQTAALEITVHGWDVGRTAGTAGRMPVALARGLLPVAAVVVAPADRGVRFARPVRVPPGAPADQVLLAHLGRSPQPPGQTSSIPRTGT
jgi:uncharacterized protein (TIGR03086 family)